jgi:hypothetical protein
MVEYLNDQTADPNFSFSPLFGSPLLTKIPAPLKPQQEP